MTPVEACAQLEKAMSAQHGCDTLLSTSGRPCNRCRQSAKALLPVVDAAQQEAAERAWDEGYAAAEADEDRNPWDATCNPYRLQGTRSNRRCPVNAVPTPDTDDELRAELRRRGDVADGSEDA